MSKETKAAEKPQKPEHKLLSVDTHGGTVVLETTAEDGKEVACTINGRRYERKAQDGQVWFQTGVALGSNYSIRF